MSSSDKHCIVDYFLNASDEFILSLGADPNLLPTRTKWLAYLQDQLDKANPNKEIFYTIWLVNGKAIGHCNINKIIFGQEGYMHLHLWKKTNRQSGFGMKLVRESLKIFFDTFQLNRVFCEPYALNEAPNRCLKKVGFEFLKTYETKPGPINFIQKVNRYQMRREFFETEIKCL